MADGYKVLDNSGYTSKIYSLPGEPPRVCKSFNKDCMQTHFPVEKAAYERFSAHNHPSSILKYYGNHNDIPASLILELAENKNLHKYRWDQKQFGKPDPENEVLYRWALQAAEALEFAHSLGVFNSDIHCVNFFLDRNLDLKVGDWAGASIDESRSQSSYRLRYRLFDVDGKDVPRAKGISGSTEIFAFGTALYFMVACQDIWPELKEPEDRDEIRRRLMAREFPDTTVLPVLGDVISKCWNLRFMSMTEVKHAIEAEGKLSVSESCPKAELSMSHGVHSGDQT